LDKSLTIELGKEWLEGQTKAFNKTFDLADCLETVKAMWESFINAHGKESVEVAIALEFEKEYYCKILDKKTWDISGILVEALIKSWCGEGKMHIYFWFLFKVTNARLRAIMLENHKLKRLFDAFKYKNPSRSLIRV